jgi:hypothetical protein
VRKRPNARSRIPRSATLEECTLALAKRLRVNPPQQFNDDWQRLRLWVDIGFALAKQQPEFGFGRGPGRPPGSKNKNPKTDDEIEPESQNKRRYRQRQLAKQATSLSGLIRMWEEKSDKY